MFLRQIGADQIGTGYALNLAGRSIHMTEDKARRFAEKLEQHGFCVKYLGKNRFRLWNKELGKKYGSIIFQILDSDLEFIHVSEVFLKYCSNKVKKHTFKQFILHCYGNC